jgi:toxin ParE1/3/4
VPQIRISPRASSDPIEMWNYIADDSLANADTFIDKLYETIQMLANQSGAGHRREEFAPGILSFPFGRLVIFYLSS